MAVTQATGNRQAVAGVWRDPATSTMGFGFKATSTQKNVSFSATSGVQGTFTPLSIKASAEVVKIEVKTAQPTGIFSGSFKAEALTASVKAGVEGDLVSRSKNVDQKTGKATPSSSSIVTAAVGAEAHIAKTEVGAGIKLGPVKIELSGSVGAGAAATAQVGVSKKGFSVSASGGAGATVGAGIKISWDVEKLDNAIQKSAKSTQSQSKATPAPAVQAAPSSPSTHSTTVSNVQSQTWVNRKLSGSISTSNSVRITVSTPAVASFGPSRGRTGIAAM